MRHNKYDSVCDFVNKPENFSKYSDKTFLSYCLGGTLYMPALRPFGEIIVDGKVPFLTSTVICFEDAIDEKDVPEAEKNALNQLDILKNAVDGGVISYDSIPLIFFRARNVEQLKKFTKMISVESLPFITGFVFPKFSMDSAEEYLFHVKQLKDKYDEPIYAMPILESQKIAFKETRFDELMALKSVMDKYNDIVLNVRVGATDFSSVFAVRRGIDYSIYDIMPVRDCLLDILNIFARNNEYILSGPVWEFFLVSKENKFDKALDITFESSLLKRKRLIDEAIDGLLREVLLDIANGFVGKTAIHPTHIRYINAMLAVTKEEYEDALQIRNTQGGVIKSESNNKMNEINPHKSWADKIYYRAKAYGVVFDETEFLQMVASWKQ